MGRMREAIVAATAFVAVLSGSVALATPSADQPPPPEAAPPIGETVEVLTDVLESLRADDNAGYDDAVDQLIDDGHWLPPAGWDAIANRSDDAISFIWLLLGAPTNELLLYAFDQVMFEREALTAQPSSSAVDQAFLQLVDGDGETLLRVIDHRELGISPQLRKVLSPIPSDTATAAPDIADYDLALELVAARLSSEGFMVPDMLGADPTGAEPGSGLPPIGVPPPLTPATDEAETPTDPSSGTGESTETPAEPAATPEVNVSETSTPATTPLTEDGSSSVDTATAAAPSTSMPLDMSDMSDGGVDPSVIALGVVALLAVALALFALRNTRHSGRLADIAYTDALTGLSNRRRLDSDLADEVRCGDRPTAVLMIDVDHFKKFNDDYGHATGDDVLRRVADIIADNVRSCDLPYRYGGEEFSVLLPATDRDEAIAVGERVREAIERAQFPVSTGGTVSVTASIGLSDGPAESVNDLVRRADQALYVAKDAGRNQLARG